MCCVPLNIVIYAGGICMNNKIRFFWKKLFLVYMITFCMAIMVIFFVSVYSYAVNIMRVSGDYVSNIATAVRDNIDIELKQYSNILHSVLKGLLITKINMEMRKFIPIIWRSSYRTMPTE